MIPKPISDLCGKTLMDRYLVLKKIGVGGFASVYRVRDTRLGCDMAIKILHLEHTRNIADLERFRNEAKLAGVINDERFVRVTDFFQEGDHFGFVMEHLEGLTLREELQRLPGRIMSWPRAFKIARQLCAGLSVAHARGLIHRDIKPENIFLKRAGGGDQIRILDLGVAKILEDHHWSGLYKNLSNTGDIIGSPCYISPEQVRGERALDVRVDIYAMGIVLYEMVAGRVPFRGQTAFDTMEQHVRVEPKRPTHLVPDLKVPRQIEDLILRALHKRPQDRYRSVQEMDAAIRNELENRSEQRRVRSVQFIQITPEFAGGDASPMTVTTSATLEQDDPATSERAKAQAALSAPRSPISPARSSLPPAHRPADTDITPPPARDRDATPKAQSTPTSPDILAEPPAPRQPFVSVPSQPKPLRIRTLVVLGLYSSASLLATCSVGTVLAIALDPRGPRGPVEVVPETWLEPAEPTEPSHVDSESKPNAELAESGAELAEATPGAVHSIAGLGKNAGSKKRVSSDASGPMP